VAPGKRDQTDVTALVLTSGDRPVRQEQAQGILIAALGMLAAHFGYGETKRAS
jgi:hypothetical protein